MPEIDNDFSGIIKIIHLEMLRPGSLFHSIHFELFMIFANNPFPTSLLSALFVHRESQRDLKVNHQCWPELFIHKSKLALSYLSVPALLMATVEESLSDTRTDPFPTSSYSAHLISPFGF